MPRGISSRSRPSAASLSQAARRVGNSLRRRAHHVAVAAHLATASCGTTYEAKSHTEEIAKITPSRIPPRLYRDLPPAVAIDWSRPEIQTRIAEIKNEQWWISTKAYGGLAVTLTTLVLGGRRLFKTPNSQRKIGVYVRRSKLPEEFKKFEKIPLNYLNVTLTDRDTEAQERFDLARYLLYFYRPKFHRQKTKEGSLTWENILTPLVRNIVNETSVDAALRRKVANFVSEILRSEPDHDLQTHLQVFFTNNREP